MPKITLLTCTHNGSATIEDVLEAIAQQTNVPANSFEVLVVDNASTDSTSKLASNAIESLGLNGRVMAEPRVGKINAFIKGIHEANGNLVSIIDDDNFIEPDFVRYTLDIFDRYPRVGMVGSTNHARVEKPLPSWFAWVRGRYACAQPFLQDIVAEEPTGVKIASVGVIAGAGSTFRAEPVLQCLAKGYQFYNDTQRGEKMKVTGEDSELCWLLHSMGYDFAHDPRIQVHHAVKADRVNLEHLKTLCKTMGAGALGIDPFLFTTKHTEKPWPIKWTWQWQLLSKLRRYCSLIFSQLSNLFFIHPGEEEMFRLWREKVECLGAIERILAERSRYTQHIRQVAAGQWTELRVK